MLLFIYTLIIMQNDKLLLFTPRIALRLSAKAFSISNHSVSNSLTYNTHSAKLLSTFRCNLKTELYNTAYSEHEHTA